VGKIAGFWPTRLVHVSISVSGLLAPMAVAGNAAAQVEAPAPDVHPIAPQGRHGSAFVDPLGFALFGPRLGFELGSGRFTFAVHGRWFNAGLLARNLFLNSGDSFAFSYGGGLRARYFFADDLSGTHLGIAAEYLHTRIDTASTRTRSISSYIVPYAEAGYRIPLDPSFYADASAGVGYARRLSGSVEDLPGGSSASLFQAQDRSTVYGTASLELGLYF